jgi:hypothetical protein
VTPVFQTLFAALYSPLEALIQAWRRFCGIEVVTFGVVSLQVLFALGLPPLAHRGLRGTPVRQGMELPRGSCMGTKRFHSALFRSCGIVCAIVFGDN